MLVTDEDEFMTDFHYAAYVPNLRYSLHAPKASESLIATLGIALVVQTASRLPGFDGRVPFKRVPFKSSAGLLIAAAFRGEDRENDSALPAVNKSSRLRRRTILPSVTNN